MVSGIDPFPATGIKLSLPGIYVTKYRRIRFGPRSAREGFSVGFGLGYDAKTGPENTDFLARITALFKVNLTGIAGFLYFWADKKNQYCMGKVALITGATAGIGKATAKLFAGAGYDLIVTGRRAERLKELKKEICGNREGTQVHTLCFDIKDRRSCEAAMGALPEKFRSIDVLVNNAGVASDLIKFQDGDISNWDSVIDTNVKGLIYITRIVAEGMVERGGGHIVNVGSVAGTEPYAEGNIYCATKYAVHGLTKSIRIDLLGTGVKVTEIRPGKVLTEFSLVRFRGNTEEARRAYEGFTPLSGEDVAGTILWAVNQPANVNIDEIVLTPLAQANSYYICKG